MANENSGFTLFELGQECLMSFLKEFEAYGISADPHIELRKGTGLFCYYNFEDRNVYLSVPNLEDPATDGADTDRQWAKTFFAPYRDSLSQSTQMAEGYLLADRTFRESWEVQRQGTANLAGTAKPFPVGFIVEVLCQYRNYMAEQIDMIFEILGETGFRYYDNLPMDPDADELGIGLRLYSYSAQKEAHRELLQIPLRWMEDNILPSGKIPLYFSRHDRAVAAHRSSIVLWGDHCMVVEANLLRGLIGYDRERYAGSRRCSSNDWKWKLGAKHIRPNRLPS